MRPLVPDAPDLTYERGFSMELSRRNFVAGAAGAMVLGAGASLALATEETEDAMEAAKEVGTSGGESVSNADIFARPYTDEYVIDVTSKGLPKWSFEIAPDPIPEDQITETIEDDIIVIGSGMAGICVAASAAEQGASVTLFSASSQPISRGGSNFSAYNKVIEEYGIERLDPVPFFYREEKAASFAIDQQMWMRGYNNSEEAMNWVIDIVRSKDVEVFLERDNINEGGPDYAIAFGAKGDDSGSASTGQQNAVEAMAEYATECGATIIYDTVAKQLIREDNNTGCRDRRRRLQKADGSYVKFVGKSIVMAMGGFCADKNMLAKYMPQVIPLVGLESSRGRLQHRLRADRHLRRRRPQDGPVGRRRLAALQHRPHHAGRLDRLQRAPRLPPGPERQHEHRALSARGHDLALQRRTTCSPSRSTRHGASGPPTTPRMSSTTATSGTSSTRAMMCPPPRPTKMIERWDGDSTVIKADTLDDLAAQTGLDAEKLKAAVTRYNELVEKGEDEDFHKDPSYLIKIDENGPFYAAQNYPMFMSTEGGLNTNYHLQVCDANDTPIPGLYNVGQMIGNMYANNYNFSIPGNSYGINCITFGYLLGRDLANGVFDA